MSHVRPIILFIVNTVSSVSPSLRKCSVVSRSFMKSVGLLSQLHVGYFKTRYNRLETNEVDRHREIRILLSESQNQNEIVVIVLFDG